MNQRAMLATAAAVTAFVLVLFAVVLPGLSGSSAAPIPTAIVSPTEISPTAAAQPQAAPTDAQPQAAPTDAQPQAAPASYAVSSDQAGTIALAAAAGATLTGTPELVSYEGVVAYEVQLSSGFAYVDASSGQILAAPKATVVAGAGESMTTVGGREHEDREHDDDEHDDREHDDREHNDREHDD